MEVARPGIHVQAAGGRSLIVKNFNQRHTYLDNSCVRGSEFVLAIMRGDAA